MIKKLGVMFAIAALIGCGQNSPSGSSTSGPVVTLASLIINPDPNTVEAGEVTYFEADGVYSDGSVRENLACNWYSANPAIATIDLLGVAHGVSVGTVQVYAAAYENPSVIRGATLVVTQAPVVPPTITTTSLPAAQVGVAYSQQLQAVDGSGPYVWSVISGSLPNGLTLTSGGLITGTCTTAGTSNFKVQVSSSGFDDQDLSIVVTGRGGGIIIDADADTDTAADAAAAF